MNNDKIRELLYDKYITPTKEKGKSYVGVEIEMPVVNLRGEATDHDITRAASEAFIREFGFLKSALDVNGNCYSATDPVTGDNLSFDCSYNNMELSFGREKELSSIDERFRTYIRFLNSMLLLDDHMLTGLGINPYYAVNSKEYIPAPRYQMLEGYLARCADWQVPMYFHPYPDFATYASASQVQLDVKNEDLISAIRAFSFLEPIKAVIFSNSILDKEPQLLCSRDMFWENSTHGINPHNIGMFERIPDNEEELLEYIMQTSIFCCERDGHYIHFKPVPISEYFEIPQIEGEYYWMGEYVPYTFDTRPSDISYLRTYKFEDLTFRGTIEYRSCCNQPFSEAMCVAAFHLGLAGKTQELWDILKNDSSIYHHGYSAQELRKIMNHRFWPAFIDYKGLRDTTVRIIELAARGLRERGLGEEEYLDPLYIRTERLTSPGRIMAESLDAGKPLEDIIVEYGSI